MRQEEHLDSGDYYLITGTDFENGKIKYDKIKYISKYRYEQDKNIQIKNDDILITKDGSIGKVAIVKNIDKPATLNAGVYRIRLKRKNVNPDYLFHYLSAPFLLDFANKQSSGGTIKHLNQSQIVKFPVPIPSLDESLKISTFLDLLDSKIGIIDNKINALKKYKRGLAKTILKSTINEWLNKSGKGIELGFFLEEKEEYNKNDGAYVHVTLSKEGISDKTDRYDRDFLVKDEDKKYKITRLNQLCYNPANLKFGVICINKYGAGIFSPIYVTYEIKNINIEYLELIVTSDDFRNYSMKYQQGTVYERMSVSPEDFSKIKIVTHKRDQQEAISRIVKSLNKNINILESKLSYLVKFKSKLLNDMFI